MTLEGFVESKGGSLTKEQVAAIELFALHMGNGDLVTSDLICALAFLKEAMDNVVDCLEAKVRTIAAVRANHIPNTFRYYGSDKIYSIDHKNGDVEVSGDMDMSLPIELFDMSGEELTDYYKNERAAAEAVDKAFKEAAEAAAKERQRARDLAEYERLKKLFENE